MHRIRIVLLFFILLGFVVFLGGELPYFLFYIVVLSVMLPLIHSVITLIGLEGRLVTPKKNIYKDDIIDINYQIRNRTPFLIPYLVIESKMRHSVSNDGSKIITFLSRKKPYKYSETIRLPKRGYCDIGALEVTVQDIFRIFKFKKKISDRGSLLVYPKTIPLSSLRIYSDSNRYQGDFISHDGQYEDKTRVNSLREYIEGDNLKSIHWKLTAKKEQPMVKVYDKRTDDKALIFIDNSLLSFKDDVEERLEDKVVDIALSIIDYSFNNNIDFGVFLQERDKNLEIQSKEMDDIQIIVEILAKLKADGKKRFPEFLLANIKKINESSSVIIITPHLNKEMGATSLELLSGNTNLSFLVVGDQKNNTGISDKDIREKLMKENIFVYHMDYSTDIKAILERTYE